MCKTACSAYKTAFCFVFFKLKLVKYFDTKEADFGPYPQTSVALCFYA